MVGDAILAGRIHRGLSRVRGGYCDRRSWGRSDPDLNGWFGRVPGRRCRRRISWSSSATKGVCSEDEAGYAIGW